jgi:hypothetical protein
MASVAVQLLSYVPLLLCLTTMRARNGYRGVHELVSGTRVVRFGSAAAAATLPEVPRIAPVVLPEGPRTFGPFLAVGLIGQTDSATVLLAEDDVLQRQVWVHHRRCEAAPTTVERIRLARPARLRWLQAGVSDGRLWEAFEAVAGAPMAQTVGHSGRLRWTHGRLVLQELAEELMAAVADGTLPEMVTLEQVWIDVGGRVRLLDGALRASAAAEPALPSVVPPAKRAIDLLRAVADLCTRGQVLPGHAQAFVGELAARSADSAALAWAVGQLRELTRRRAELRWDDRLGILAVTAGLEYTFFWLTGLLVSLAVWYCGGLPFELRMLPALAFDVALPAILGFWWRGGPVFHFLGIEVRRPDGRPAGRLRCAWRNVVAWVPLISFNAVLPIFMLTGLGVSEPEMSGPIMMAVALLGCGGACVELFALGGVLYAILSPRRGIQDLLAGTCLVPR